jgi:hypothetical protein
MGDWLLTSSAPTKLSWHQEDALLEEGQYSTGI